VGCEPLPAGKPEPIPNDFKILARYSPGFSDWLSWEDTITADGKVAQVVGPLGSSPAKQQKQMAMTKRDLSALVARVKEVQFFQLKHRYSNDDVTCMPTLFVAVTAANQTHTVEVYAYHFIKEKTDRAGVDRFLKVWTEVLARVPCPNPQQGPDMYR
jgi:hypothetical protein